MTLDEVMAGRNVNDEIYLSDVDIWFQEAMCSENRLTVINQIRDKLQEIVNELSVRNTK